MYSCLACIFEYPCNRAGVAGLLLASSMCIDMIQEAGERSNDFIEFYRETCNIEDTDFQRADFPRLINSCIDKFDYYTPEKFNATIVSNDSDFNVLNVNIRGLATNFDNFILYLSTFSIHFDAIIVTECHIQESIIGTQIIKNMYPILGYSKFSILSTIKYGGVVIYIKDKLEAEIIPSLTLSNHICDTVYLRITNKGSSKQKPAFLGGIYRHCRNQSSDIMNFICQLDEQLGSINPSKNKIIIGGDFNIDLIKSVSNKDSLCLLNTILQHQLENHIFKPTRIQYHKNSLQVKSATIIDIIASNLHEYECTSGNILYPDSDHHATFVSFSNFLENSTVKKPDVYRRNIKDIDLDALDIEFGNIDWNNLVFNEPNLDKAVDNMLISLDNLLDSHAPLRKLSKRKQKYVVKPWIDYNTVTEIKHKNMLYHAKSKCPSEINIVAFKTHNNSVTTKRRNKKKAYFREYFQKHKHDSSKMWIGINQAMEATKSKKQLSLSITDVKGKLMSDSSEIAESFANYFEQVPEKTLSKLKRDPDDNSRYLDHLHKNRPVDNYLVLYNTNNEEVDKLILSLKDRSSPGPLVIPNRFLKLLHKPLAVVMTHIINMSMDHGYVPTKFKVGKQTPVFKSGAMKVSNFRPITVCNSLAKILEKAVRTRVMKHIKNCNILTSSQYGFRKKHSTTHAMINLLETSLSALDEGLKTGGIFLDISKAFDCVSHRKLLRKLEYYGFRANTLMWFESYLTGRSQYVSIRDKKSRSYNLTCGVPQGGTLAPILFILFINDIVNSSEIFDFSIYADDTCLIIGICRNDYNDRIKTELQKVMAWFNCNDLLVNVDKTDYLHLGPNYSKVYIKGEHDLTELHSVAPLYCFESEDPSDPDHTVLNKKGEFALQDLYKVCPSYHLQEHIELDDGTIITENDKVKYLGLYFDSSLIFKHQVAIVSCKVNRLVGIYWKMADLDLDIKKTIYHSLVESHLNYGILIWGSSISKNVHGNFPAGHVPENLKPVKKAQNKVIRAIFRVPKYDRINKVATEMLPLYKKLEVMKLHDLYYYNVGLLCFNYLKVNDFPDKLDGYFLKKSDVNSRDTRSGDNDLYYQPPRLSSTYRKPSLCGAAFWNTLPEHIKNIKKLNDFKFKLKRYFLSQY